MAGTIGGGGRRVAEALHAWLTPRDPTGVYRLMLDLMLLLGLWVRECRIVVALPELIRDVGGQSSMSFSP
ncbi:hypothetical protein HH1059_03930 [Halorhodospira halochloris]|uniref:Uncharacterized protein n=1 Tax=Halorhodospira halochloris TaxID=1052 RepID=A0A0X8X7I9_HALHR|nr:hypothetical protein [Halorhodospira halochloris]BAU57067.1 hypothetical protein HH1059_03930 [Halorhodospira halochloris]